MSKGSEYITVCHWYDEAQAMHLHQSRKTLTQCRGDLVLLLVTLMAFSMWFYVDRVWAPPVQFHLSDLYPRWYGARELLLHGRDPYSSAVTGEIQVWSYGHALAPDHKLGAQGEDRFAYPLYVALLLAPTLGLPYQKVEALFRWLMPVFALGSVLLWLFALRWKCSRIILGSVLLLSFFSFPVLENIYLQQPVLIAGACMAGAAAALSHERQSLAGTLLGLATVKPQLSFLLVAWLLVWAFSDWRLRKRMVWSFSITMLVLVGASELLLAGWIGKFAAGVAAYQRYTPSFSILTLLLTKVGGAIMSAGLLGLLAWLGWRMRHASAGSEQFAFTFCAVLAVTLIIIPTIYPSGQLVLLPALFFLVQNFQKIWANGRASRLSFVAVFSLMGWQWIGSFVFMWASVFIPLSLIRQYWIIPVSSILLVPLAVLVSFSLLTPAIVGLSSLEKPSPATQTLGS